MRAYAGYAGACEGIHQWNRVMGKVRALTAHAYSMSINRHSTAFKTYSPSSEWLLLLSGNTGAVRPLCLFQTISVMDTTSSVDG